MKLTADLRNKMIRHPFNDIYTHIVEEGVLYEYKSLNVANIQITGRASFYDKYLKVYQNKDQRYVVLNNRKVVLNYK